MEPEQINIGSKVIMTHAERQALRQREGVLEKARQALRAVREFEKICPMGTWNPDESGVDVGDAE